MISDSVAFLHSKVVKEYADEIDVELHIMPADLSRFNPVGSVSCVIDCRVDANGFVDASFASVTPFVAKAFCNPASTQIVK